MKAGVSKEPCLVVTRPVRALESVAEISNRRDMERIVGSASADGYRMTSAEADPTRTLRGPYTCGVCIDIVGDLWTRRRRRKTGKIHRCWSITAMRRRRWRREFHFEVNLRLWRWHLS